MSDPFASHWMQMIPLAILGASLLGSGHCVAMCGGLIVAVARTRSQIISYHLGRLIGYVSLGTLAGYLGSATLQSSAYAFIPWVSTVLLAGTFILLGIRVGSGKSIHLFHFPRSLWSYVTGHGPGVTGVLSAFLPCGWLHAFILSALATQSAALGALSLFVFWLGTLPALSLTPIAARKVFQPLARRAPRLSALILITIGLGSLAFKMIPLGSTAGHCHDDPNAISQATEHRH